MISVVESGTDCVEISIPHDDLISFVEETNLTRQSKDAFLDVVVGWTFLSKESGDITPSSYLYSDEVTKEKIEEHCVHCISDLCSYVLRMIIFGKLTEEQRNSLSGKTVAIECQR